MRAYIEELLPDILDGRIEPGRVFDRTVGLDGVPDGYRAMADRESIKVLVQAVSGAATTAGVVLAIILTGYLLILIDVSILMAALPRIHADLGFSATPACHGRRTPTR